jgi:hypothetical protein
LLPATSANKLTKKRTHPTTFLQNSPRTGHYPPTTASHV